MRIGILGSGSIGGALGRSWAQAGHDVVFASRHPDRLADLVARANREAGEHGRGGATRAGTSDEAMAHGEVVLDALPFAASMQLDADALRGKLLVTASNLYPERDGDVDLGGRSQSQALAGRLPGARVVKAFNMMFARRMAERADGKRGEAAGGEIAILLAGDDEAAKATAGGLIEEAGFVAVDAGGLGEGRLFQSGGPLYAKEMTGEAARAALRQERST